MNVIFDNRAAGRSADPGGDFSTADMADDTLALLDHLELERAQATLALRTVRSPVSGVVVERLKSPGEFVEDKPILRIAQLDPLRVEVIVPVGKFGTISTGMRAEVTPELARKRKYIAEVSIVDKVVDAASGTFGVRLELPNPGNFIPGGLRCSLIFLD